MNPTRLSLLAISLAIVLILSGCVVPEVEAVNQVKKNAAAEDFLATHVNAQLTTAIWTAAESQSKISKLIQKCGPQINPTDYYYISFREGDDYLEAWVYQRAMNVACVWRSDDKCITNSDCEDGALCTQDICDGIPKTCSRERIRQCFGGDGCCPSGCTFSVDFDCEIDECTTHRECDDKNPATNDSCEGLPKKCVNELVSLCVTGDNYCPSMCDYSTDQDCLTSECETASECNDNDSSTTDTCEGDPMVCKYEKITNCIDEDNYCPIQCNEILDSDCIASSGNEERITVTCNEEKISIDKPLLTYEGELKASFNETITNANNEGMIFENFRGFKYNGIGSIGTQTSANSGISGYRTRVNETLKIEGRGIYDRTLGQSFFEFSKDGFRYEVAFEQGVPATASFTNQLPFISGTDDEIAVPLFGKDGLLTKVNQEDNLVEIVSDYKSFSVDGGGTAQLAGKDGQAYLMKVGRCDGDSAIFYLYDSKGNFVASQEGEIDSLMFEEIIKGVVRIGVVEEDYATERCNFEYVTGTSLEQIIDEEEFPADSGSGWIASLEFEENRLKKIGLERKGIEKQTALNASEIEWFLPTTGSQGYAFCSMQFVGLAK